MHVKIADLLPYDEQRKFILNIYLTEWRTLNHDDTYTIQQICDMVNLDAAIWAMRVARVDEGDIEKIRKFILELLDSGHIKKTPEQQLVIDTVMKNFDGVDFVALHRDICKTHTMGMKTFCAGLASWCEKMVVDEVLRMATSPHVQITVYDAYVLLRRVCSVKQIFKKYFCNKKQGVVNDNCINNHA